MNPTAIVDRTRPPRLLAALRDDGPLEGRTPTGLLPLPEAVWLSIAILIALVPPAVGTPVADVAWVAAGGALAVLGTAAQAGQRLRWPVPALLRTLEYGAVIVLAEPDGWMFLLLAVLAFHHYDIVYRLRLRGDGPPGWLGIVTGGWPGRLAILLVATTFGIQQPTIIAISLFLLPIYLVESILSWRTTDRPVTGR